MAAIARLNQHVVAMLASMNGFAVGVILGWNSLAGLALRVAVDWESDDVDLVIGILGAGAAIGTLTVPLLFLIVRSLSGYRMGLRTVMAYLGVPLLIIGWILVCMADYSYDLLIAGRLVSGMGVGALYLLLPLYIAEVSSSDWRDANLYYFHVLVSLGVTCAYGVACAATSSELDTVPMDRYSLGCAVACLSGLLCCAAPDSPLHLMLNDEVDNAKRSLGNLGWNSGQVQMVEMIERDVERMRTLVPTLQQPLGESKTLKEGIFWRRVALASCIMTCQQLSGATPITFNALTLIDYAGSGRLTSSQLSLLCGTIQSVCALLGLVFISRLGRRIILTFSSAIMGLSLILLAWFIRERGVYPELSFTYNWLPPATIAVIFGSYSFGLGPISWSLLADSFPIELRIYTASIIACVGWLMCLVLNLKLSALLMSLDIHGTLWLFAGFCCFGAIIAAIFVRESRGKSLADMQEEFRIS